jgi:hypothetical protein
VSQIGLTLYIIQVALVLYKIKPAAMSRHSRIEACVIDLRCCWSESMSLPKVNIECFKRVTSTGRLQKISKQFNCFKVIRYITADWQLKFPSQQLLKSQSKRAVTVRALKHCADFR